MVAGYWDIELNWAKFQLCSTGRIKVVTLFECTETYYVKYGRLYKHTYPCVNGSNVEGKSAWTVTWQSSRIHIDFLSEVRYYQFPRTPGWWNWLPVCSSISFLRYCLCLLHCTALYGTVVMSVSLWSVSVFGCLLFQGTLPVVISSVIFTFVLWLVVPTELTIGMCCCQNSLISVLQVLGGEITKHKLQVCFLSIPAIIVCCSTFVCLTLSWISVLQWAFLFIFHHSRMFPKEICLGCFSYRTTCGINNVSQ